MKKFLSLALVVVLTLACASAAFAAGQTVTITHDTEGWYYWTDTITLEVTNVTSQEVKDFVAVGTEGYQYNAIGAQVIYCDAPATMTFRPNKGETAAWVTDGLWIDWDETQVSVDDIAWSYLYYSATPEEVYEDDVWFDLEPGGGVATTTKYTEENFPEDEYYIYADGSSVTFTKPGTYVFNLASREEGLASIFFVVGGVAPATPAPTPTPAATQTVNPTPSTVYVDGNAQAFEAYNIGGNNFFKLRDLAMVLNGSGKQFAVGYDNATKAITLTGGQAYAAAGGELTQGDGKAKTATPTASSIYLDGKELSLTVYNIGGNNFFKLRDLMAALDVYVGYDEATKAITVDSTKGYVK